MNLSKDLVGVIRSVQEKGTKPYDSQARVTRVEGQTVWVHIPGGVDETPVKKTISAKKGDVVQVRVSGGSAFLIGNASSPPTDDTTANAAKKTAGQALGTAVEAVGAAEIAGQAAANAQASANSAAQAADEAWEKATDAEEAATTAQTSADNAQSAAARAQTSADNAQAAADQAQGSADVAQAQANAATRYANNALSGLSTLESVIDTVNWFADHRTASRDTTVQVGKTYYVYNATTGTLSVVTPEGTENPSQEGWFELDEAIASYVATRIAETDDGLFVVGQANGWKVLVSSGEGNYVAGIYLIDPNGGISQATTAGGISFSEGRQFKIGNSNTYILFDPSNGGHITINGGSRVTIGGNKTLSDVIVAVEYGSGTSASSHYDITSWSTNTPAWEAGKYIWQRTTNANGTYTYTCIQGAKGEGGTAGQDAVLLRIDSSRGNVFKNNAVSTVLTVNIIKAGETITTATRMREVFGSGAYLQWLWKRIGEDSFHIIVSTDSMLSDEGFTLTLTPDKVDTKVTFQCELNF